MKRGKNLAFYHALFLHLFMCYIFIIIYIFFQIPGLLLPGVGIPREGDRTAVVDTVVVAGIAVAVAG